MVLSIIIQYVPTVTIYAGEDGELGTQNSSEILTRSGTAVITDDNFLGTGQITLNVNNSGTGYDFTNALVNPKNGLNYNGQGNMWELRLNGKTASCLNFGAPATYGNTYSEVAGVQNFEYVGSETTINDDLQGLLYGYERLLGNHGKFGISDPEYEKLSHFIRADGILTVADCYIMMQILTWRITCQRYCYPSIDYEKAMAHEIFYDLYGGDSANWKLNVIDEAYSYLMKCISDSRSGIYKDKYGAIKVHYYRADDSNNQDLMIWDVEKSSPKKVLFTKRGAYFGMPQAGAIYTVSYTSDMSYCFTQFTTDNNGKAMVELEEGIYYVHESEAPQGAEMDDKIYSISVTDSSTELNLYNNEVFNYLRFNKYEAGTSDIITDEAEFDIYEWNSGKNTYLRLGKIGYDGNGQYSVNPSAGNYIYHDTKGNDVKTVEATCLYYTEANKGRFKIVETKAPVGWKLATREFSMNSQMSGATIDLTDPSKGVTEYSYSNALEIEKIDGITGEVLSGAEFMVQEKIGSEWFNVGQLTELTKIEEGNAISYYRTDSKNSYEYHDTTGKVTNIISGNAFPLHTTVYNKGEFRVVETKSPDDNYVVVWSKEFRVSSDRDYSVIKYTRDTEPAVNYGKSVTVRTAKYDELTQEIVNSVGIINVYEYISAINEWRLMGNLEYDSESHEYVCDDIRLVYHDKKGNDIELSRYSEVIKGLCYTSVNQGRFMIKEEIAPQGYQLGVEKEETLIVKSAEFFVDNTIENGAEIKLLDYDNAAKDTGIKVNVELAKRDSITGEIIKSGDAEFTVYEKVDNNWLKVGKMIYDSNSDKYTTLGMNMVLHNSGMEDIYSESESKGLRYTTANAGQYKIVETGAPSRYSKGVYVKEFSIAGYEDNHVIELEQEEAPYDLGFKAKVSVNKYDDITGELVLTGDTVFSVYEYVSGEWMPVGNLKYNSSKGTYSSEGVRFLYHDKAGNIINTDNIKELEEGYLYYTEANKGRFRLSEYKAPSYYTLGHFVKDFEIIQDNQEFIYNDYTEAAKNIGVAAILRLKKYDRLTGEEVSINNGVFTVQEYISDIGEWIPVTTLRYDTEMKQYTSSNTETVHHDSKGNASYSNKSGKLMYTTANQGRFRVIEEEAPDYYVLGNSRYVREFNVIKDSIDGYVNYTDKMNSPYNCGINGTIRVAKYDSITHEKVLTGNAEFTVYEKIQELDKWMEIGKLVYNEEDMEYTCEGAEFIFHDRKGNIINTEGIEDFESGKIYHTSVNGNQFKVEETKSPDNYNLDGYIKEFSIQEHDMDMSVEAAYDSGISGVVKIMKVDNETEQPLEGAVFALQEWSVNCQDWLSVGNLMDKGLGLYSTESGVYNIHTGIEDLTVKETQPIYTTQNQGKYRIVEIKAPKGYINDGYESEIMYLNDKQRRFDFTKEGRAGDTSIKISVSKKSITSGKNIIGARLTVTDNSGNIIDSWITDGSEHFIEGIVPGKYILTEESAPQGYIVSSSIEFEVKETYEIQKVEMFDEVVKGKIVIDKMDKNTGAKLSGAKFVIKTIEGQVIQYLVTDENGHAQSELIDFGIYDDTGKYIGSKKYILEEVDAPEGYGADHKRYEIEFEYVDDKTEIVEFDTQIENEKVTEPGVPTGNNDDMEKISAVLLMLLAAGVVYAMQRVTQDKSSKENSEN